MTYSEAINDINRHLIESIEDALFRSLLDKFENSKYATWRAASLIDEADGLIPLRPYLSTADALKAIDAQHAEEARCEARDAALVRAIGRMG